MNIIPPYLLPGDEIIIAASARKITPEELEPAISLLTAEGFKVLLAPGIYEVYHQFAGTDAQRAASLNWAFSHPTAKAVILARGGYGTVRIVDSIDAEGFLKYPKWICGYSDVTVWHNQILNWGVASIHSTMPINFNKHIGATRSLIETLKGSLPAFNLPSHPLNREGVAHGVLTGGNLSILYALSNSVSDVDLKGKILFIEDLDEYLYHIDRMMMQLKRAGKLKALAGLVVGGMSDMKDNAVPFGSTAEEIVWDAIKEYDYPVCFGFPAGHIDENLAFFLGRVAHLEISKKSSTLNYSS